MSFATRAKYLAGLLLVAASVFDAFTGNWDRATYALVFGGVLFYLADTETPCSTG